MSKQPSFLPAGFETESTCEEQRATVAKVKGQLAKELGIKIAFPRECSEFDPCESGLCPVCFRRLRKTFLRFAADESFHERSWLLATIFVEGWTTAPGDHSHFGPLKGQRVIKNLLQRIRRLDRSDTVAFGSIETVYKTVANEPVGKPFHIHLMASGMSELDLKRCIESVPLDTTVALPLVVDAVSPLRHEFIKAASYPVKQPFWKKSYPDAASKGGIPQWPKAGELAELIANMGAHALTGRLFFLGMRFDRGSFRLIQPLKSTENAR